MKQMKELKKTDPSSATLLSTPKQKQAVTDEETLLVTETFHLPSAPEKAQGRFRVWRNNRKLLLSTLSICAVICFLVGLSLFQNIKKIDADSTNRLPLENGNAPGASPSSSDAKREAAVLPSDEQSKRIKQTVPPQTKGENPVTQVAFGHRAQQMAGKNHTPHLTTQSPASDVKTVTNSAPENPSHMATLPVVSPATATTASSNVFSYGARSDVRLASPGTAEASLRSSRALSNNMTFSYGSNAGSRRKKRNSTQLRFKIKDSGTRSVQ